jgi:hypothetical protein
MMVGQKNIFGIEYEIGQNFKLGYVRIWLNDIYIGAWEEVFLSYLKGTFLNLISDKNKFTNFPQQLITPEDIVNQITEFPVYSIDKHILRGLGESFDDFYVVCFIREEKIHFVWKLVDKPFFSYPNYPKTAQMSVVDIRYFEKVVNEFMTIGS